MVETKEELVNRDIRTEQQRSFDEYARLYRDLKEPIMERDNPDALFANGWGRKGHFALLVAPSGVGKSVITTQDVVPWAAGKPGLVGSAPLKPLRIAIIQAEDDDTEMSEFRRDHRLGYQAEGWTIDEILGAEGKIWDLSPFFRGKTNDAFINALDFSLGYLRQKNTPIDVVVLNPLQSYTGFDISKNDQLSAFLRTAIDRLLVDHKVFMLCVHHTNKPATGANQGKGGPWGDDATAAYVGAGGAELTNYARSVTVIRRCTEKECKLENSFVLLGAKRGNRLGWKDADGNKTNKKIIAYSENYIHWRVPTPEELEEAGSAPRDLTGAESMPELTPEEAAKKIAEVIRADWPKIGVKQFVFNKLRRRVCEASLKAGWSLIDADPAAYSFRKVDDGRRAFHFEHDPDAGAQDLPNFDADEADGLDGNDSQPDYGRSE